jgi:oxygen-independent coproporphyrinogen-3 oxidase
MLNALRLTEGFPLALFTARTGLTEDWLAPGLKQAIARGLVAREGGRLRPTALGRRFLNDLLALFVPPVSS